MAQPLTAEWRITFSISVAGLIHKLRVYCAADVSILAASGYFVEDRTGIADIDAGDAAQAFWTSLRPLFKTTVSAPGWLLEHRVGSLWNPATSGTTTGAGTDTGSIFAASQMTVSLRTTDFNRVRIIVLESDLFDQGQKFYGYADLHAIAPALAEGIAGVDAIASGYFQWARSRNKKLVNEGAPIVSTVFDLNDKVRRSRNVQ